MENETHTLKINHIEIPSVHLAPTHLEAFLASDEEVLTLTNGDYSTDFSREQVARIIEMINNPEYRDYHRVQ